MQEFKDRLRELREERGLSMKELGNRIGVSDAAVCKWENGVAEPKLTYILRLAAFFECSTDFLLGVNDDYSLSSIYEQPVAAVSPYLQKYDQSVTPQDNDTFRYNPAKKRKVK